MYKKYMLSIFCFLSAQSFLINSLDNTMFYRNLKFLPGTVFFGIRGFSKSAGGDYLARYMKDHYKFNIKGILDDQLLSHMLVSMLLCGISAQNYSVKNYYGLVCLYIDSERISKKKLFKSAIIAFVREHLRRQIDARTSVFKKIAQSKIAQIPGLKLFAIEATDILIETVLLERAWKIGKSALECVSSILGGKKGN